MLSMHGMDEGGTSYGKSKPRGRLFPVVVPELVYIPLWVLIFKRKSVVIIGMDDAMSSTMIPTSAGVVPFPSVFLARGKGGHMQVVSVIHSHYKDEER